MTRQRAFTLIELLVVIAIIALLMSILMPVVNKAKEQAKAAICRSNLHQWALIWQIYTNENDGYFSEGIGVDWERGQWIIPLRPHWETKSAILRCPMAKKRRSDLENYGGPFNTYIMRESTTGLGAEFEECSYGMNCWLYNPPSGISDIQDRPTKYNWRTPNVKGAANVPLFADTMWRGGGPWHSDEPPDYDGQWKGFGYEMGHFCIDRHGRGTVNHLFLDFSTAKVGLKQLWEFQWHRNWNPNNDPPPLWTDWMKDMKEYSTH
jgi:prepilin-type N-terminal cleavage/methylation domain-containing protein